MRRNDGPLVEGVGTSGSDGDGQPVGLGTSTTTEIYSIIITVSEPPHVNNKSLIVKRRK